MSKEKDPQEVAFFLLTKVCRIKQEELVKIFENIDSYLVYSKQRVNRNPILIKVPNDDLKLVQQTLLHTFLYRLKYRTDNYKSGRYAKEKEKVSWQAIFEHLLNPKMHGQIPKMSLKSAVQVHTKKNSLYLIKMDLKNAYPSVTTEVLEKMFFEIFIDECKAYYFAYLDRFGFKTTKNNKTKRENFYRKTSTIENYPVSPLFPSNKFPRFRKWIRDIVKNDLKLEDEIGETLQYFTEYLVRLFTFEGSLPKGAPTSGFLLNLVVSESKMLNGLTRGGEVCSVYVDDILITTSKKPNYARINRLIVNISKSEIFKYNPQKVRIYDLRNKSGNVLGMKLVRRPLNQYEKNQIDTYPNNFKTRGYQRADRTGRVFMKLVVSLSKKKQKQYRAFLHKVTTQTPSVKEKNKAMGYYGHIISVYGWPVMLMPASLATTVQSFREKFNIVGIK